MAAVPLTVRQGTPEWEDARRDGIASSDMPVIMGNRPGLLALWAIKSRLVDPPEPDAHTAEMWDLGHRLEPVLADLYTERTGRPVRRVNRMLSHPKINWAYASLDRVSSVKGDRRIVELKTNPYRRWSEQRETIPAAVQDQVMWQMLVVGYDVADVAVLESGAEFKVHELGRDDGYIDDLLYAARWFRGLVERGERPEGDDSRATRQALGRLFPRAWADLIQLYAPDPTFDELAERLRAAKAALKAAEREEGAVEAAIKALLGEAAGVISEPGGYQVTWKNTKVYDWPAIAAALDPPADLVAMHTHTDWKAVAETLRPRATLKDAHASLTGPRRLLGTWKKAPDGAAEEMAI